MHWFIHPIVVVYGKTLFLNEEEQGGGPVIDIATHSLDLTLYLMNNYESAMVLGKLTNASNIRKPATSGAITAFPKLLWKNPPVR